ncbi:IclR family transcriptional regulator [Calidifontibacillus erzurumensis]|uniref:Glycerol operon regulatory protein n=1 Tax=Calidifontibacillus erzurumensis TaxID=2741433 RepID=A0A8J8KDD7_9BACI|nr:IclR family transcriptional regulator [Calidifontibacillus erzurumensis]NSL50575.1 IclR family transcriptional regulator [Calidifontibacillus erzurumensis]
MKEKKADNDHFLSSVKNALLILRSFTMEEPEKKISEIASTLGLNKSTVSRTMATLASEGFVYKDPETKKYRLGMTILSLSGIIQNNMDIFRESQPVLNKLVRDIDETAHIAILDNTDVIYILKIDCNHYVRALTHVGRKNPVHCTSSGKVLLAYSDESTIQNVIDSGLKMYTNKTIIEPAHFKEHLKKIKKDGFAYSLGEFNEGVNSVAAPIFDYTGKVIAALTVVGPMQRITEEKIRPLAKKVIESSMEISERMGYWR